MHPQKIICDRAGADGGLCGQRALVHSEHYIYSVDSIDRKTGARSPTHTLREAHYDISCPRCGRRTQIVRFE